MKSMWMGLIAATLTLGSALADPGGQVFDIVLGEIEYSTTFNEDGTYSNTLGSSGNWSMDDENLCLTPTDGAESICNPWDSLEVGESTTTTVWSPDGSEMVITRVE